MVVLVVIGNKPHRIGNPRGIDAHHSCLPSIGRFGPARAHSRLAGWTAALSTATLSSVVQPRLPKDISPFARSCIDALAADGLGRHLSLGGAFGLAHYHEYRPTHDVDAWWRQPIKQEERDAVVRALTQALTSFGIVRTRSWGEVVSVELEQGGKTVFSFQIAHRSAQIDAPIDGVWPGGLGLDSFDELVASKMRALVERGAPRDFRDIHSLCMAGLCSAARCWQLWETRQRLAREDADRARARSAIVTHLSRLAVARPLDRITDAEQREKATGLRAWFQKEFLA